MVPVDKDAAASVAPEPSASWTAASNEGAEDMSMSWYLTIPGIGTIGLDTTGIPSNDQEILEAVTEWVFANPSLLYAIVLDLPVSRQDGDAGGSAPSTAPEAEEGVLGESAASAESATIAPPPPAVGETTDMPLLQPAEAAMVAPTPSMVGAVEEVVGGAKLSSSQPVVAAVEEVPAPSQPTIVSQ
jgi:hypothetical protein